MQTTTAEVQATNQPTKTEWRAPLSPLAVALGALLVVQLLAALVLGLGSKDMDPAESQGSLLAFDLEQVTGVRIQATDGEPVLISKTEGGWVIPSLKDLPAAGHKVSDLLSKLDGLQKGLPVATSEEALKRFKVSDQAFERKLTLESGDTPPAILYLGDSPGFRRLFVRADGDSAVYEAALGLFDVSDKADDWSDRSLLHLDAEKIERLTFAGLILERKEDTWRLADLAEGEEQDDQAIEDAVRDLASIDFVGVVGDGDEPAVNEDPPPLDIEATLASGVTIGYRITKLAEGNDYLLVASNRPQRFTLASYAAEDLTGMNRADLLTTNEEAASSPPEEPQPADTAEVENAHPGAGTATSPPAAAQEAADTSSGDLEASEASAIAPEPRTPEGSEKEGEL